MSTNMDEIRNWWDKHPCNILHSKAHIKTEEYSREVTAKKYKVEPHIIGFAEFDAWRGKEVLDAGCGIGTMALDFARFGAHVTAVDLSPISVRVAARRMLAEHIPGNRLRFLCDDLEHLSESPIINDRKYDLIFSFGVIHHTANPGKALRELWKLAHKATVVPAKNMPGWQYVEPTELRIMLYHKWSTKAIWLMLTGGWPFKSARKCIERQSEANKNCPVAHTYSKRQAKKLLRENGWEPISIKVDHIFPYQILPYKRGEYKRKWYWRYLPRFVFRLLEKTFGWHLLIKAVPSQVLGKLK